MSDQHLGTRHNRRKLAIQDHHTMTEPVRCSAKYTDIRERGAHLDDGGVLFAALDELVVRELGVLVLV